MTFILENPGNYNQYVVISLSTVAYTASVFGVFGTAVSRRLDNKPPELKNCL